MSASDLNKAKSININPSINYGNSPLSNVQGISTNYPIIILITALFTGWIFLYTDIYFASKIGVVFFVIILLKFVDGMGKTIPVKELIALMFFLQLLVAPVVVYNYLDNRVMHLMEIEEEIYIDFVFMGSLFFLLGLFIPMKSGRKENLSQRIDKLKINNEKYRKIGFALIIVGFSALFTHRFVPGSLQFFFYLLSALRFIGLFYILFSRDRHKLLWVLVIFGQFGISTILGGSHAKLFEWGMFFLIYFLIMYRFNFSLKLLVFLGVFYAIYFTQSFKKEYREVVWTDKYREDAPSRPGDQVKKTKQDIFLNLAVENAQNTKELYSEDNFNKFIDRYNQGWILSKVLDHIPKREPFTNGEMLMKEIRASILPRILDPDKPTSGGEYGKTKFLRCTGKYLMGNTRMTIGLYGDAYANFGFTGGMAYIFAFGLFLNLVLSSIYFMSKRYPSLLLWIPFIFFPITTAANETLIILNQITKSSVIIFLVFLLFKKYLLVTPEK